jgi:HK97 gp10 family phage protein
VLTSSLPKFAEQVGAAMEGASHETALMVAARAKEKCPVGLTGNLRDAIHVEHAGPGRYRVVAGNEKAWYGHLVEHGTSHSAAKPFLAPAVEETRAEVAAAVAASLTMGHIKAKLLGGNPDLADFDGTGLNLE